MPEEHESAERNRGPLPFLGDVAEWFIAPALKPGAVRSRRPSKSDRLRQFHIVGSCSEPPRPIPLARPCDSVPAPSFSERSLEVRLSVWGRAHACAGAQQRDRAAEGGARSAEREKRESITPLFAAPPASRAPVLLTPHYVRGFAISALRAPSDHFYGVHGATAAQRLVTARMRVQFPLDSPR